MIFGTIVRPFLMSKSFYQVNALNLTIPSVPPPITVITAQLRSDTQTHIRKAIMSKNPTYNSLFFCPSLSLSFFISNVLFNMIKLYQSSKLSSVIM